MKKSFDDAARDYQAKLSKAATQLGDKAAELQRVQAEALFKDKRVAELEVSSNNRMAHVLDRFAGLHRARSISFFHSFSTHDSTGPFLPAHTHN